MSKNFGEGWQQCYSSASEYVFDKVLKLIKNIFSFYSVFLTCIVLCPPCKSWNGLVKPKSPGITKAAVQRIIPLVLN